MSEIRSLKLASADAKVSVRLVDLRALLRALFHIYHLLLILTGFKKC
jgi:hypothetical protein